MNVSTVVPRANLVDGPGTIDRYAIATFFSIFYRVIRMMKFYTVFAASATVAASLVLAPQAASAEGCTYPASGDILAAWSRLGGATGVLGCPRESQHAVAGIAGSFVQKFEHGEVSTSPSVSPHMTLAAYLDDAKALHVAWNDVTTPYGSLMIGTRVLGTLAGTVDGFSYRTVAYAADGTATFAMANAEDVDLVGCPSEAFASRLAPYKACNTSAQAGGNATEPLALTIAMAPPPPPPAPVLPDHIVLNWPSLTFSGGTPVGGWANLTLFQNGNVSYSGHLHDSGFPNYSTQVVCGAVSADGIAFAAVHSGSLTGFSGGGQGNDDWNQTTTNAEITSDWPQLVRSHPSNCTVQVNANVSQVVQSLVQDLNTAASLAQGIEQIVELF